MFYIKLEDDMTLVTTVYEPIYRGDNLNQKITYLIPKTVGDIDILTAVVYLNIIRADGEPDVVMLERSEAMYKETYYQYVLPVTCKLSKYAGEVLTWMQIYSGTPSDPAVAKSSELMMQVLESKDIDDYIGDWRSDKVLTALYQMKVQTDAEIAAANENIETNADNIASNAEAIGQNAEAIAQNSEAISQNADAISQNTAAIGQNAEAIRANIDAINANASAIAENKSDIAANAEGIEELHALVAEKADSLVFNSSDSTIQLTAGGTPIGARIYVNASDGKLISSISLTTDGEMLVFYSDGSYTNLGKVVGENGKVYVPHIDAHKVLTFTIEDEPGEIPDPTDLNPEDDWGDIDESDVTTDYVWEGIEDDPGNTGSSDGPEWQDGV